MQWWDPAAKCNLCDRVDGDLIAAIARAREIEERLTNIRASGQGYRRLRHEQLVERFLADLQRRADAGAIDPATVRRYSSALSHYLAFCQERPVEKIYPYVASLNRDFRLQFTGFLKIRRIAPNGHPNAIPRPMTGQVFVMDTVRAMLEWAADPNRGQLLGTDFRNPFLRLSEPRSLLKTDPLAEPDITLGMAIDFVQASDRYQLLLFVPMIFFGLRANEPSYLFRENVDDGWLKVLCNVALDYRTKGRRDKRFPLIENLSLFWDELRQGSAKGLLYVRRQITEGNETPRLHGASLQDLVAEFQERCANANSLNAAGRQRLRDHVLSEAGGLKYDHIEHEFHRLARILGWPPEATLKDLRHLFCTMMGNTPMPEGYRRYLMGHSPGKDAVVAYTHLNQVRLQYGAAVEREWSPLIEVVNRRVKELSPGQALLSDCGHRAS